MYFVLYIGTTQGVTSGTQQTTSTGTAETTSAGTQGTTGTGTQGTIATGTQGTTSIATQGTTGYTCDEMEYINILVNTNSITVTLYDVSNDDDFITEGVDLTDNNSIITIKMPNDGAIVRDMKVGSTNVEEAQITFTTSSGHVSKVVRGSPTSLPTDEFPSEKVIQIVIEFIKTTNGDASKGVTLSVIVCAEGTTVATSTGE